MRKGDLALRRDVLAALVEQVAPVRMRRGQYEVTIIWTPLGEGLRATVQFRFGNHDRSAA